MNELEQRLARAEAAIERLTAELAAAREQRNVVTAPFRVVNTEGRVLMEVSASRSNVLSIYNHQGLLTAQIGAQGEGGFVALRNDAGKLVGYLTTELSGGKLELRGSHDKGGVFIGTDDIDGGWMNVLNTSGGFSLTLGSDSAGGFLHVYDAAGEERLIALRTSNAGGEIEVLDTRGAPLFRTKKNAARTAKTSQGKKGKRRQKAKDKWPKK